MDDSHKRILRNTGMLYIRMLLAMAVSLYTSRVVLDVLGVEDFGLYHVVAGFVALLGFMQGAMTSATQRYFAFDLGANNGKNLRSLFNTSLQIHALMAICIALVAETAGYWFVSTQLTIPVERIEAALWAYHLAIAAFAISVMTVPLTAMLMANERMGLFALMSMADVLLKLMAVLVLRYMTDDKLVLYAALLLGVAMLTFSGYFIINRLVFSAVRLEWAWNAERFRSMLGFTAWSTWGNLASAMSDHGSNVLLNIFFGPAVNAGKSISAQANGALNNFVANVQAAISPQIIKLYASGDSAKMNSLVMHASRYNFFILFTLALPVLLYAEVILDAWLTEVPPYAAIFLRLTIIVSLISSFATPLITSAQATGHIRQYQAIIGGIQLLTIPVSYLILLRWRQPEQVLVVTIGISMLAFVVRLVILKKLTRLDLKAYVTDVIVRSVGTAVIIVAVVQWIGLPQPHNMGQLSINVAAAVILAALGVFIFGLSSAERRKIEEILRRLGKSKRGK